MKLAEALSIRAELQQNVLQIKARLLNNAKVQEGEKPLENPLELIDELNQTISQLEQLIKNINYTNCMTTIDGNSITDLIAQKDALTKRVSILREFLNSASEVTNRYSATEIKTYSTVDVPELQKSLNLQSKQLRELDMKIQGINWTTELLEK